MRFYTDQECADWCKHFQVPIDERNRPIRPPANEGLRCGHPRQAYNLLGFSRRIECALQPRETCLMWVTDWEAWPGTQNLHLYYRFRQSYGDYRLVEEAPGHLFLDYESSDLASFIHLALLNSWDAHLLPTIGYGRAFLCHDDWIQLCLEDKAELETIREDFKKQEIKVLPGNL